MVWTVSNYARDLMFIDEITLSTTITTTMDYELAGASHSTVKLLSR